MPSPTPDPGNVAAVPITKIDRRLVQRQLRGCRPELKLVAVTAAPMAIVAAQRHVHRERAAMARRGGVERTASIPLHPRAFRGLEADTGHVCSSLADGVVGCSRTVPFPFIFIGGT